MKYNFISRKFHKLLTAREVAREPAVHGHAGGGGPSPVPEHAGRGVVTLELISVLIIKMRFMKINERLLYLVSAFSFGVPSMVCVSV